MAGQQMYHLVFPTIEEITREQYNTQVERRRKFGIIELDRELTMLKYRLNLLQIRNYYQNRVPEINSLKTHIQYKTLNKMREMDF